MASERDREIWDDATNAVCQAMQEHHMCNCPDGDCLAAKIDFSPEKIATATRPAPAATDAGLETVRKEYRFPMRDKWELQPKMFGMDAVEERSLVTRSQAAELLAAERAEKEAWRRAAIEHQKRAKALEAKLAAAEKALKPFSYIAGELFAANFNNDDVVFKLHRKTAKGSKLSYQMTAKAFFEARAALGGKLS